MLLPQRLQCLFPADFTILEAPAPPPISEGVFPRGVMFLFLLPLLESSRQCVKDGFQGLHSFLKILGSHSTSLTGLPAQRPIELLINQLYSCNKVISSDLKAVLECQFIPAELQLHPVKQELRGALHFFIHSPPRLLALTLGHHGKPFSRRNLAEGGFSPHAERRHCGWIEPQRFGMLR